MSNYSVLLPNGQGVPRLGQGTWQMADDRARRADEVAALRAGLDLGLTLIDTAEMYGDGRVEELVAEALAGRRDEAFIVSKVYPQNASRSGVVTAAERSLKRLKTDRIDLYLLHWMGRHPLAETVAGFEALQRDGKIGQWGVSNLDTADMKALWQTAGGRAVATNQVLYNLTRRGLEWSLGPWLREHGVPMMAYSPVEQSRLVANPKLKAFAGTRGWTAAQVALAWLLAKEDVIVIPKASRTAHVTENAKAREIRLSETDLRELEQMFPGPSGPAALDVI